MFALNEKRVSQAIESWYYVTKFLPSKLCITIDADKEIRLTNLKQHGY